MKKKVSSEVPEVQKLFDKTKFLFEIQNVFHETKYSRLSKIYDRNVLFRIMFFISPNENLFHETKNYFE